MRRHWLVPPHWLNRLHWLNRPHWLFGSHGILFRLVHGRVASPIDRKVRDGRVS